TAYPEMAVSIAHDLFTVDGSAPVPMRKKSCAMRRKWASST
ncbi:putative oxidoreductase FixC, partial [Salmonella enterica subsp. enterica serovar Enteritidis str. 6.0562-1]